MKVLDFGLAKALDLPRARAGPRSRRRSPVPPRPGPASIMGTAAYMSPEQARVTRRTSKAISGRSAACSTSASPAPEPFLARRSPTRWPRSCDPSRSGRVCRWARPTPFGACSGDAFRRTAPEARRHSRRQVELDEPEQASTAWAAAPPSRTRERLLWVAGVATLAVAVLMVSLRQPEHGRAAGGVVIPGHPGDHQSRILRLVAGRTARRLRGCAQRTAAALALLVRHRAAAPAPRDGGRRLSLLVAQQPRDRLFHQRAAVPDGNRRRRATTALVCGIRGRRHLEP